jgi:hypothetical protein
MLCIGNYFRDSIFIHVRKKNKQILEIIPSILNYKSF